ncbi:thioredoxin domain-containing protein [Enterobacteriaceae endosymbiont of Plateumaris pusilla]|uniref:DsbA family protein n=1 Tax=Enterobacteriaceae endosymbiont of Plateumaris pusilla TaxID=2675795 RepID=UPI00144948AB|nr:DsbA family protein [Enterobacteriaceae endosymbiont of Plateumaris pusilla]QJC29673.1 thioredoxin domain-containing protein [Enterobacteriaceae endosymbiont of Plateumaris pusilla]
MNIKKYILLFSSLFFLIFSNICLSSTKFVKNIHYKLIKQSQNIKLIPDSKIQITEFFSFLCPHCYDFYNMIHKTNFLNKKFLKNLKIKKYHINNIGNKELSELATYNWSIAIALHVESKVLLPIFEGLQKSHKIYDYFTMRKIFIKSANIDKNIYDAAWNSFIVKALNVKQQELSKTWNITSVPFIIVNNNYHIILDTLDITSSNTFINDYINLVKILLKKKIK